MLNRTRRETTKRHRALVVLGATITAGTLVLGNAAPALAHDELRDPHAKGVSATSHPIGKIAKTLPSAVLLHKTAAAPKLGTPSVTDYSTTLTRNPDTATLYEPGFTTPADACAAPICRELDITVPAGSGTALYARASWELQAQYVQIWGVAPDGTVVGNADVDKTVDKTTGNSDAAQLAEFTVKNPMPGAWKIQVRAVYGVNIPVHGYVALTKGEPLVFPTLDVNQLADKYLTQHLTYNIVFVNRTWSKDEVAAFEAYLPDEYRSAVVGKGFADGCGDDTGAEGEQNWAVTHFCGTGGNTSGTVPYFEPLKYTYTKRFLQSDKTWTADLFAEMKKDTAQDVDYDTTEAKYLAQYNTQLGLKDRGPTNAVADPTKGDKIDAFKVEDWIFKHRYDSKYAGSFRDVKTGAKHSGAFIDPDKGAYYDPFYTAKGKKDLEHAPQGASTSLTFFAFDTFNTGETATVDSSKYFGTNAWHTFDVSKYMVDPDIKDHEGPDFTRAWGGRYRFFMHDLGAAPNYYEAVDFFLGEVPGSAAYPNGDPPVWDYDNDPMWSGQLATNTARDAATWLFARLNAGYLYRPIPADVYYVANNNWQDCYSNPQCSPDGLSYTKLDKVYDADYVTKNLGAALPGVTFETETSTPSVKTYRYLGCAANRAVANPDPAATGMDTMVLAPDPNCVGKKSDIYQEALELAKSRGDELVGAGVNDSAVSPAVFRAFVERNRATIAPIKKGQLTITNVSVVFPGSSTWALPAIVGGVAFGTPNEEGWGVLNNINDRFKYEGATDCSKSKPGVFGCGTSNPRGESGFSYTIEHESSHFLGLLHPHDMLTVEKGPDGKYDYYGSTYRHYGDFSMAPTTYAGAFAPYSVLDQDIIQRGHAAEYLRQAQDYLADAYLVDGAHGMTVTSAATQKKVKETAKWRTMASQLFACGDYLHSERAMRNASLTAQGIYGPVIAPRPLKSGETALFTVSPQAVYGPDGGAMKGCVSAQTVSNPQVVMPGTTSLGGGSSTGALPTTGLAAELPLLAVGLLVVGGVVFRRRRTA